MSDLFNYNPPPGYTIMPPNTNTGLSRCSCFIKIRLAAGGAYIFLEEASFTPESFENDMPATILDIVEFGVVNLHDLPILIKRLNDPCFQQVKVDEFGNCNIYRIDAKNEDAVIDYFVEKAISF